MPHRPVHLWMKPLKNADTKQVNSSNTVWCSMNIPAQPPQDCVKGPFVQWATSSALMAHMEPLTHRHAPKGEGRRGTSACRCRWKIWAHSNQKYQPWLSGTWHRSCGSRSRHRAVEWARVCLQPVGRTGGKGMSGRQNKKQEKETEFLKKSFIYQQIIRTATILHKGT